MRSLLFLATILLLLCIVTAQWDEEPCEDSENDDPECPGEPDDDPPWPTPTSDPDPEETSPPDPPVPKPTGIGTFYNVTIYQPDNSAHLLTSPRTEYLTNNTMLAAWNDAASTNDTLLVYRSSNHGFTWHPQGGVRSTVAGRRLLEPHLLFIEDLWSGNTNVTLLAVNAVDVTSTNIELYASYDQGETFEFVHRIAEGGPIISVGGAAVVEPFMLYHDKRLTVYFSDQRDGQHAQKVVQLSTEDMWTTWGTATDVTSSAALSDILGSLSAAEVRGLPNNQYLLVVESMRNGTSQVQYGITENPENSGIGPFSEVRTATGPQPRGASYVTWSPLGGSNGTIVLSDSTSSSVFINQALGAGHWREIKVKAGRAYGREVRSVPKDKTRLSIAGGSAGLLKAADVLLSIIDLEKAIATL
ncbi:hypothetical protein LEMA_P111910.1 [Plenodomus lingam JN3]|uniref:Uncharacterized protein n=1 Tax=Leptosphaeria maculans (strain JN3 / isolate v23.1.3 / race Av1-4-5-6-7-8) TaxID=985895 RepID=E4ZY27_LEPMJ|nr:hypothetical protein LEMA_P111910.1 [Plenodomus lingam JN3]CBX96272.1 hypothetical protein LEMA_P111910.1 [Plenodomus lingam JN3]